MLGIISTPYELVVNMAYKKTWDKCAYSLLWASLAILNDRLKDY